MASLRAFFGIFIILIFWWAVTQSAIINEVFLPSPISVFQELFDLIRTNSLTEDLLATTYRTLLGFGIGCLAGILGGLIVGSYHRLRDVMEFPIDFFRSIPATAIFPLFIAIWGVGDQTKISITAWASSMVVLINTIYGVKSTPETQLRMAKLKKLSAFRTYTLIRLPSALTHVFAGIRTALSFALIVQIVAEMFLGANNGLGHRVYNATSIFEMSEAYAVVIVIGVLGFFLNKIMILLEAILLHWK